MAKKPSVRLTYEDWLHFPDDGRRWELIDGEAYVSASPNLRHQRIVGWLHREVLDHLERHGGGEVFVAPVDVRLSRDEIVVPDVVFVSDADAGILTKARVEGVPTWIVEVLSDPRRDRVLKRQRYERFGVPEYWIIDPDADHIEVYRLTEGVYPDPTILGPTGVASPLLPTGLEVDLAALFAR